MTRIGEDEVKEMCISSNKFVRWNKKVHSCSVRVGLTS